MSVTAAFQYRVSLTTTWTVVPLGTINGTTDVSTVLTGLPQQTPGATYDYQLTATDSVSGNTVYGDILTFQLQDVGSPQLSCSFATPGVTSATINATLSAFGGAATSGTISIGYGSGPEPTTWTWTQVGAALGTFPLPIINQTPGATIYFGAKAANNLGGTNSTPSQNFIVGSVVTMDADTITPTSAKLYGTVNFATLISLLRNKAR